MEITLSSDKNNKNNNNNNLKTHILQKELEKNFFNEINNTKLKYKELVGNNKEFRIDNNYYNICIIGNNNCIRISKNNGNIQIIGNNTRLKIKYNTGSIKYTGNKGCICLGNDSTQQIVDYIGCNGIMKIVNSSQLNSPNKSEQFYKNNLNIDKNILNHNIKPLIKNIIINNSTNVQITQ